MGGSVNVKSKLKIGTEFNINIQTKYKIGNDQKDKFNLQLRN